MFKSIGIHIHARLRREMDRSDGALGIISPGYSQCMNLIKMITDTAYCPMDTEGDDHRGGDLDVKSSKYFSDGHAEGRWLHEAVRSADRLQFFVKKGNCEERTFELHFFAYRRLQKEAFFEMEFYVSFLGAVSTNGSTQRQL